MLLLLAPTALWTMFNSHRSDTFNHFLIKAFGATLLLLNFCVSGLILRESRAAANVLADALGGLSDQQLKRYNIPLTNLQEFAAG